MHACLSWNYGLQGANARASVLIIVRHTANAAGGSFRIAACRLAAPAVAINSGVSVSAATLPRYLGEVHPSRSSVTTGSWGGSC